MATVSIVRNADRTISVKAGKYRETISTDSKSNMQLVDEIRWIGITAGVDITEEQIWEHLQAQQ